MEETEELPPSGSGVLKFWLVAALVALAIFVLIQIGSGPVGTAALGKPLVDCSLQPLAGDSREVSLADLKGKVSVVNFWGTWCPPCRLEFPHLVALGKKFEGRDGFQFLPVSCGSGGDSNLAELREDTEQFLQAEGFDLPVYADPRAKTRRVLGELLAADVFSYPTTLVVDRTAMVRGVWVGYRPGDEHKVEALVEKLLAD